MGIGRQNGMAAGAVLLLALGSVAAAADMRALIYNGPDLSSTQERANKAMGLMLHRTLFVEGDPQLAADIVMNPMFINHDVEEPSGAQHFADFFLKPQQFQNPNANPPRPPRAATPAGLQRLFIITDNNITMMAYPTRGSADEDPGRRFASNMMEVKSGKVTQWWFSGPTNNAMAPGGAPAAAGGAPPVLAANAAPAAPTGGGPPPAAQAAPDYSKFYPQMGNFTVSMQSIISLGATTTRAEREANKALVARFVDEFFNKKNYTVANELLSSNLMNHIEGQPSGAGFAAFARANKDSVVGPQTEKVLFNLAEGELVAIGYAVEHNSDPGAWYAQNLARVKGGKIVEWWFSGYPYGAPRFVNPWNNIMYSPGPDGGTKR